jgi:hypothetical protein
MTSMNSIAAQFDVHSPARLARTHGFTPGQGEPGAFGKAVSMFARGLNPIKEPADVPGPDETQAPSGPAADASESGDTFEGAQVDTQVPPPESVPQGPGSDAVQEDAGDNAVTPSDEPSVDEGEGGMQDATVERGPEAPPAATNAPDTSGIDDVLVRMTAFMNWNEYGDAEVAVTASGGDPGPG